MPTDSLGGVQLPALRHLLLGRELVGVGEVEAVPAIRANPYASRIETAIAEVITSGAGPIEVLVKGGFRERTRQGVPWGTPYEACVYERVLPALASYQSPYLGSATTGDHVWLFLRWLDGAHRVDKHPDQQWIVRVAAWLGGFHREAATSAGSDWPSVVNRFDGVASGWARLALANLRRLDLGNPVDRDRIGDLAPVVERHLGTEPSLTHGDFFPSNVLVQGTSVVPVDWEWAAIAAGEVDLAALVAGWRGHTVAACTAAYRATRWPDGDGGLVGARIWAARFFFAVRALGRESLASSSVDVRSHLRTIRLVEASLSP